MNDRYKFVVRAYGRLVAERECAADRALSTTLREWIASDEWTGLCDGMTISVERIDSPDTEGKP